MKNLLLLGLLICLFSSTAGADVESLRGEASVIDGDTIKLKGKKVRLEGIDAPESKQLCYRDGKRWSCGREAAIALNDMITGATVTCYSSGKDRFKRILGTCEARGVNLNQWMVLQGYALVYRSSTAYRPSQSLAKARNRGLWGAEFRPPWEWRKDRKK